MSDAFLGIDIGAKSGAFAIITDTYKLLECHNFVNFDHFYSTIKNYPLIQFTALEDVRIWPGSGAQASTGFMKNAGGYESILEVLKLRRELVLPQKWQKAILGDYGKVATKGLPKKAADRIKRENKKKLKQKSILRANQMFGLNIDDDGQADSINLAVYAMKVFRGRI